MQIPGKLVPTLGYVREMREGMPKAVEVPGLAFVPDPLPPAITDDMRGRLLREVNDATAALMRLESLVRSLPNPQILLVPLRRREVTYSSKIENTIAAIDEVAMAEINIVPPRQEVLEVRNNLRALEHGLQSPLPMCLRLIREMHAHLMEGVRGSDKTPGEFRTKQVFIGEDGPDAFQRARFVPPPAGEKLAQSLDAYEKYLNPPSASNREVFLLELAMSHYQFECIHPFADGNGRLGRLIIALSGLKSNELSVPLPYISRYLESHRDQYYDGLLGVSNRGDWEGWFRFFCKAVRSECLEGVERAARLLALRESYRSKFQSAQRSSLTLKLVDLLFQKPAVTVASVRGWLGITAPAAQKHISLLERTHALTEVTGGTYGRVWVAQEILAATDS